MKVNDDIRRFLDTHHLDYFYDIGGCETCGPEYEWNCSCGKSGYGSGGFGDHQYDAALAWNPEPYLGINDPDDIPNVVL